MGRGEYYKNKYGRGGGRRHGNEPSRHRDARSRSRERLPEQNHPARSWGSLVTTLESLEGQSYGSYNLLRGQTYRHEEHPTFTLAADSIQGDAYAAPSRFHVVLDAVSARYPTDMLSTKGRRIGVGDFLARRFVQATRARGADARLGGRGWHGAKGGDLAMDSPSQYVLDRTNVIVAADGSIEARFTVGLPARGRTICGDFAANILTEVVPALVQEALVSPVRLAELWEHVKCVEDQAALRDMLAGQGLVAFVADGSILPRQSGAEDSPMPTPPALPFHAPRTSPLRRTFTLPHRGEISGLGIPPGITLLVGGGYHGKSTVLQALESGVFNVIRGDGREFVATDANAVKIRAEDGRSVGGCNVSPFIGNLPSRMSTQRFTSGNASGSTSQAANIMEAIEVGATTLLMDEDTCATNFMTRDRKMQQLVAADKEPITPFITKARALFEVHGVSSVIVVGALGDYFSIADTVILMDTFQPKDVTEPAKAIAAQHAPIEQDPTFLPCSAAARIPDPRGFQLDSRHVRCSGTKKIQYGDVDIDLTAVGHLVEPGQVRAIAHVLRGNLASDKPSHCSIAVKTL
ncbi:hypothetical protein, variant 1 [Aphanomyces invadans]|uniref:ABC transporter ATPase n=1 Tax=Aphanomyces invadans TaxID=157072 RepID=A0A024TSQ5_9STRA|nr:hypothetical protein, variant 1 [Aphanomyces invadans]ETV97053.1 hypothetical protein, variant 1 [Aphanomyces invadans]|eukprot:XP_008874299.1 hypothetical protein, variant 1 [Aphanomyces invadans]